MSTTEHKQALLERRMAELDKNPNPWYKEPWPWILMSGPAIAVVACIITIYLAFSSGGNEPMGGATKRGLVVEVEFLENPSQPAQIQPSKEAKSTSNEEDR